VIYTLKTLVNQLVSRFDNQGKKSGIIVTSSIMSHLVLAGNVAYCASKSYAACMAEGLAFELRGKVDVLSYEPSGVNTKMLHELEEKEKDLTHESVTITPERAAALCVRDLGKDVRSVASFRHEFVLFMMNLFPINWLNKLNYPNMKKIQKETRIRNEKKKDLGLFEES